LSLFKKRKKPLTWEELLKHLRPSRREMKTLQALLDDLTAQGKLIRLKNAYGLADRMRLVTGVLDVTRSGAAFLVPDDPRRKDIFISPSDRGDAWDEDKVVVAVVPDKRGRRPSGRVVRILKRAAEQITAKVKTPFKGGMALCTPTNPKLSMNLMTDVSGLPRRPKPGEVLVVKPGDKMEAGLWSGEAQKLLGREKDIAVQEALVKVNHGIKTGFPDSALKEAQALPEVPDQRDFKNRKDLTKTRFVTIDGAKARDFDDAIFVQRLSRGYKLLVAIADVAHYVEPGSALDREAKDRANSYYFPESVEPMFPKSLSNGLCSLNPDVVRLAMVVEMNFSSKGNPGKTAFYPAVIKSSARLTYGQVKRAVLDKDKAEQDKIPHVLPMLTTAEELARLLLARRQKRGSLDFDLPEPEIQLNLYGETVDIRPKTRHFAHQIIEEFMIAANEAVAEYLEGREAAFLYRVHPEPDAAKLKALYDLLKNTELGGKLPPGPEQTSPKALQKLLAAAEGTPLEFLVSRLTLRTMMQAKYGPENHGHYGLASQCYCHFTSPIRRYADLVVHRALKAALGLPGRAESTGKDLVGLGAHLSQRERIGMDAEREILKRLTIIFMEEKIGETFTGVVSSLADFGFWVELSEVMAEGLVRLSSLHDDYYSYFPERQEIVGQGTGKVYKLGSQIRVRLVGVSLARLEVEMTVVD